MPAIICYHCFHQFGRHRARFKCGAHTVHDKHLGPNAPKIFDSEHPPWQRGRRINAACPDDGILSGFRVCPECHRDLPYHAGRSAQRIIAIVGCQGSGKTLYLWSLLYQVRERLTRQANPFATAMFEDDDGFSFYQSLSTSLLRDRRLPGSTQAGQQKQAYILPITIRLLGGPGGQAVSSNLVFYDPAGELVHSLRDVRYLRYLIHAAGIIYLVDPTDSDRAAEGLGNIVENLRTALDRRRLKKKAVALVLTKADEQIYPSCGQSKLLPAGGSDTELWSRYNRQDQQAWVQSSGECKKVLQTLGHHNLLALATRVFGHSACFAVSSLGCAPRSTRLTTAPNPIGVEHPLYWLLRTPG